MSYLDNLNERQKQAAEHQNGPLLIVAGAGAGKTKTIAARIVRLVQKGVRPENILASLTEAIPKKVSAKRWKLLGSIPNNLNRVKFWKLSPAKKATTCSLTNMKRESAMNTYRVSSPKSGINTTKFSPKKRPWTLTICSCAPSACSSPNRQF